MASFSGLRDSFSDGITDTVKWPGAYTTSAFYTEANDQVKFTLVGSTAGSNFSAYISDFWDVTGTSVSVEVPKTASTATSADTFLQLDLDGNNHLDIVVEGTTIFFQKLVAGVKNNISTATYSATAHRWWKISESGGVVTWWTSSDGRIWASQGTELVSNLFAVTALQADIGAGTYQSEVNPGFAYFDNFNITKGAKFNNSGLRPHPFSPGLAR